MLRTQLVDMIYEELYNELHKKGHKDPKGRKLMKGSINKSDAKYTMRIMFDNHGFGKALKHMKILRRGITLNMSSYMGPGKVLDKIVKVFNDVMGTKYKIDVDSFQKGHVTSIELKEGKINEMSATARKHGKFGSTGVPFPTEKPNEFAYMDFAKYIKKNEKKVIKFLKQIRPDAIFKALENFWSSWDRKTNNSAFSNIRGNKFGRELALMLRKDGLVFKNTGNKITNLKEAVYDKILKAVPDSYSYKNLAADIAKMIKDEYGSHNIRPFIKELTKLLKEGKLTEASNVWKRFDAMQKLQGNIMDVEDVMRDITNDLKQLHMDMEQEAEPGGGKVADRYGRDIEKKEKEYKKKKAEFKKLMKQLDKLEQF